MGRVKRMARKAVEKEDPKLLVLIVEDDVLIRTALARELRRWGAETSEASSEVTAIELLDGNPDLVILDVKLEAGGSGVTVAQAAAERSPRPVVLAISAEATPMQAFQLAQSGVVGFIPKPIDIPTFSATVEAFLEKQFPIGRSVALEVGRTAYSTVLENVRRTMLTQALGRTNGNKGAAARLLQVTRQAVQQMIKDFELET